MNLIQQYLTSIRLLWYMVTTCIPNMNNIQLFMREISQNKQQLWQNRHKYPILAGRTSILYVHKVFMMVYQCTQHEQNPLIYLRYITTNIQNVLYNGHNSYSLAQNQGITIYFMNVNMKKPPIITWYKRQSIESNCYAKIRASEMGYVFLFYRRRIQHGVSPTFPKHNKNYSNRVFTVSH